MTATETNDFLADPAFDPLDRKWAALLARVAGTTDPALTLAAALVSRWQREGHVCLYLPRAAGTTIPSTDPTQPGLRCPELTDWVSRLRAATRVVGAPGEFKPLILDSRHRLYLHRYWCYENELASWLAERAARRVEGVDWERFRAGVERLCGPPRPGQTNWQKLAAFAAVRGQVTVISGGPGTGKTHTAAVIAALLLEQARGRRLRLALAAPTGKAAARMLESFKQARERLDLAPDIRRQLPEEASTLHRLLGARANGDGFRHDARNPLPVDAVLVDECSMVDLALMARLVSALPASARLVLLGDMNQLASVEAGAVLGDVCNAGAPRRWSAAFVEECRANIGETIPPDCVASEPSGPPSTLPGRALADCIVELRTNFRFGPDSGIQTLSTAINAGEADRALEVFRTAPAATDVRWAALPAPDQLATRLAERVVPLFPPAFGRLPPTEALAVLGRFRILCAVREGPYGVGQINHLVETVLRKAGRIRQDGEWYAGRPVMVTRNDYDLELFNGDIGVTLADPASRELRVFFPGPDGGIRHVAPYRLPEHETVYAMTVHKSQGSEFDEVLLVLPAQESRVMTRELVYTGLTRARRAVELWADEAQFRRAVARRIERVSGLREALWGADDSR